MGWGLGKRRFIRVETRPLCRTYGCQRNYTPAEFGCLKNTGLYSCGKCFDYCCVPLKVGPIYDSPLMKLGSWVFANKNSISGAPEDLLLAAYAHVEARMVRCAHGSARARATERWLGQWARIIDRELTRQAAGRVVGVALNDAPAGGLVEVEVRL